MRHRSPLLSVRPWRPLLCLLGVLGGFGLLSAAPAGAVGELDDKKCLECHYDTDLTTRDPLTKREYRLAIDMEAYRRSSHAALPCRSCHERGYARVPHTSPRRRDAFRCLFCHREDEALADFKPAVRKESVTKSAHREAVGAAFDCHACHDPHVFRPRPAVSDGPARVAWANAICLRCHGEAGALEPFEDAKQSVLTHMFLPHTPLHLRVTECISCHGDPDSLRHTILPVEESRRACTSCHTSDAELLRGGYGDESSALTNNAGLFDDVYVIGATRSMWLDRASQAGFLFAVLFILVHALVRIATRARRD